MNILSITAGASHDQHLDGPV